VSPMRHRFAILAVAVALALPACDRGASPDRTTAKESEERATQTPPVPLGDLSTSLEAARAAFNAHKGEARFLTLLSPT
jgi:hypothetical protein